MEGLALLGLLLLGWVVIVPIIALIKSSGAGSLNARVLALEDKIRELEDKLASRSAPEAAASARSISENYVPPDVEVETEVDSSKIEQEPLPPQPFSNDLVGRPALLYAPATDAVSRAQPEKTFALQAGPDFAAENAQELPPSGELSAASPEGQTFPSSVPAATPVANPIADAVNLGRDLLQKSNLWVLGGVVLLLCALVFLAKLAVEMGWYNPPLRLATGGLVGIALLCLGWRSREKRPQLGQIMQGGGIAALYLVVIAAVKLPEIMLSPLAGLPLLLAFVLLASILSILQNAPWMAHLSMISGFLAPLLMSDGSGNYIALFSVFIILNIGMLLIFRFRDWGHLCLTNFILTYGIGGIWGLRSYTPELWLSVEPFLLAFTACYGLVTLRLSALVSKETETTSVNKSRAAAVFSASRLHLFFALATPTIFLLYQLKVVGHLPMAMAFSGLALGFVCLFGAWRLWKRCGQARLMDAQTYFVLSVTGLNLALLFSGLDTGFARVTMLFYLGVTWVVEGSLFIYIPRHNSDSSPARPKFMRGLGMVLMLIGALLACIFALQIFADKTHILNGEGATANLHLLAGSVIISIFCLLAAWGSRCVEAEESSRARFSLLKAFTRGLIYPASFVLAALWLLGGTFAAFAELEHGLTFSSLTLAGLLSAAMFARSRLNWTELRLLLILPLIFAVPTLLAAAYTVLIVLFAQNVVEHPELALGFMDFIHSAAPLALFFLPWAADRLLPPRDPNSRLHGASGLAAPGLAFALIIACLPTLVYGLFSPETLSLLDGGWFRAMLLALSLITLWLLIKFSAAYGNKDSAVGGNTRLAIWTAAAFLPLGQMFIWQYNTVFAPALMAPLPYIPLLNLWDLGAALVCLTLWFWWRKNVTLHEQCLARPLKASIGEAFVLLVAFLSGHGIIFRALDALFYYINNTDTALLTQLIQICVTLYWGLCGFTLMFSSKRLQMRRLWICGATLLLAAAAKTVIVDTAEAATLARVGVYFGIGLLFICTGYFIPVPGSRKREPKSEPENSSEE